MIQTTHRTEHDRRTEEKLKRELGPLILSALNERAVEDIARNSDGWVWIRRQGQPWSQEFQLNDIQAENILRAVASSLGVTINPENPTLDGELILDGSRVHGNLPPESRRPSFTIRKKASLVLTLEEYVTQGALSDHHFNILCKAIHDRENIFIIGSTGSGKTVLVNALIGKISEITPHHRVVIIEDTGEIQCAAPNTEQLYTTPSRNLDQLVKETLRMRPDRIIIGEVRGAEALNLLEIWNSGHRGGIATAHADTASPLDGLQRLEMLIARANAKLNNQFISRLIASTVNLIVCICETEKGRRINNISKIEGFKDGEYLFTTI